MSASRPDNERAAADQQNSGHEDESDARAEPAEHFKNKSVGAHQQPFLVRERRHHLRARLAQQVGNGDEFVAFGAQPVNNLRQRGDGVGAISAAIVHQDDVAATERRVVQHALDN